VSTRRRIARWIGIALAGVVIVLWLLWTAGTVLFSNLQPEGLRQGLTVAYLLAIAVAPWFLRPRRRALAVVMTVGGVLTVVYALIRPSNDREWIPEVAVEATADVEGSKVTVRGVRNFRYRSETDFDVVWEDRSYDLDDLRTLDLFMSFWGPIDYCHTIVSFGFEGGEHLAASVEVRKEVGETYSTFGGLFKMFELSYVFSDERDVIGVRTNHREEDVYLYRLRADPDRLRELFLAYVHFANDLAERPQFYGVIENSCGVNIVHRVAETGQVRWSKTEALLNGYWDRLLYEAGALDRSLPFEELRTKSRINPRAQEAGKGADFSARVRAGLPEAPRAPHPEDGAGENG